MHKSWIGNNVLITTQNWFLGKDGRQYRAIWGKLKGITEVINLYGFVPSRSNANWVVEIGGMVIAGCQVFYSELCPDRPPEGMITDFVKDDKGIYQEQPCPTHIYFTIDPEDPDKE